VFIRKRISPSRQQTPSYQVIESYRSLESGTPRQKTLVNLGPHATPAAALKAARAEMRALKAAGAPEGAMARIEARIKTLERIARKLRT
jgi:hypothetical protein